MVSCRLQGRIPWRPTASSPGSAVAERGCGQSLSINFWFFRCLLYSSQHCCLTKKVRVLMLTSTVCANYTEWLFSLRKQPVQTTRGHSCYPVTYADYASSPLAHTKLYGESVMCILQSLQAMRARLRPAGRRLREHSCSFTSTYFHHCHSTYIPSKNAGHHYSELVARRMMLPAFRNQYPERYGKGSRVAI